MRVCRWRASCVAVEGNPRFAVSAATLTCKCGCRSRVWLVLLVGGYSSGPSWIIWAGVISLYYSIYWSIVFIYKAINWIVARSSYISITRLVSNFAVNSWKHTRSSFPSIKLFHWNFLSVVCGGDADLQPSLQVSHNSGLVLREWRPNLSWRSLRVPVVNQTVRSP